jgi:hypothetical protein
VCPLDSVLITAPKVLVASCEVRHDLFPHPHSSHMHADGCVDLVGVDRRGTPRATSEEADRRQPTTLKISLTSLTTTSGDRTMLLAPAVVETLQ